VFRGRWIFAPSSDAPEIADAADAAPDAEIVGVVASEAPAYALSFQAGRAVSAPRHPRRAYRSSPERSIASSTRRIAVSAKLAVQP
jgi:hypothetical protein